VAVPQTDAPLATHRLPRVGFLLSGATMRGATTSSVHFDGLIAFGHRYLLVLSSFAHVRTTDDAPSVAASDRYYGAAGSIPTSGCSWRWCVDGKRVASPGACCRKISLHGRPCTITFAFGDSPDCGTESTINFGMKCESNEAGMLARVQPLWIVRAWPPSKRGRSGLRCCEAHPYTSLRDAIFTHPTLLRGTHPAVFSRTPLEHRSKISVDQKVIKCQHTLTKPATLLGPKGSQCPRAGVSF
jgi:hypothetical protein